MLEISGSHSNIISDSYVFHYGNEVVSCTGNKEIRRFVTTKHDQKYPFAVHVFAKKQHDTIPGSTDLLECGIDKYQAGVMMLTWTRRLTDSDTISD